jgi:hypothetical protein
VTSIFPVGSGPSAVSFTNKIYVANYGSNTVSVINAKTYTVVFFIHGTKLLSKGSNTANDLGLVLIGSRWETALILDFMLMVNKA